MVFSPLAASLAVAALSALPYASASSHMIMGGLTPMSYERIDPIVNMGSVSGHVHALVGANNMNVNSNYDSVRTASCTGVPFQDVDKSVYWAPPVYYQDQNTKQFSLMPSTFNIYYFFDRNGPGEKVHAFPAGLKMVAGNPSRVGYNASNFADKAVSFVCLDYSGAVSNNPAYAERQDINFPNINNCKDGIRYQIFFPQCWDGVNLDTTDHKSHMAYPIDNYNGGSCPSSHPVHTVGIFYEMIIPTSGHNWWGDGAYVLSTGETTGLAFHADFLAGWDVSVLQDAVDNCHDMNGDITKCQVLVPYINQDAAHACRVDAQIVNEDVGQFDSISALPGCNLVHNGYKSAPAAASSCPGLTTPGFKASVEAAVSGWGELGCIVEGTNGRALSGASMKNSALTPGMCAQFCGGKGFTYAGVEFGDECYCGNSFSNGATGAIVDWYQCNSVCAGNSYENCGGPQRLTLLKAGAPSASSAAPPPPPPPTPTTSASVTQTPSSTPITPPAGTNSGNWKAAGCVLDASARALTDYSTTDSAMTVEKCTSTCASKGFSIAGVEFGQECYCGNTLKNNLGTPLPAGSCSSTCAGNKAETCGGSWALSLYTNGVTVPSGPSTPSTPAQPSASSPPVAAPSGSSGSSSSSSTASWVSAGCVSDGSARALTGYYTKSTSMTTSSCQATCASKGYLYAGLEYGQECYCGNTLANGLGAQIDAGRNCYMTCSSGEKCGGTWSISLYKNNANKKRKHFGRQFQQRSNF